MSNRGELSPELAQLLRDYADKVQNGTADSDVAEDLRQLARAAAGKHRRYSIKVHRKLRGGQPLGPSAVDRDLEIACQVKAYMVANGCGSDKACLDLSKNKLPVLLKQFGEKTIKNAWQKMGSLVEMSEEKRRGVLFLMKLKARGLDVEIAHGKRAIK